MYNKNKGPKVIPWGIPLKRPWVRRGAAPGNKEDVSFDLVHFVCHIWRKYRSDILVPLAKDTTDSHLLFPAIFFPQTRTQSSCLGKRSFCIVIGHENDIIIFIDSYMPIHISVVSCDGQLRFLLRTCCSTRFVKEICSFGQWFGLHCISFASLSDWWLFN